MQHEILVSLLGYPGSLIGPLPTSSSSSAPTANANDDDDEDDDARSPPPSTFGCTALARSFLSRSEVISVNRTVAHGGRVAWLRGFVRGASSSSPYVRAVASVVRDRLRAYEADVARIEGASRRNVGAGVAWLRCETEARSRWIPAAAELARGLTTRRRRRHAVDETARRARSCGDEDARRVLEAAAARCRCVLSRRIRAWTDHGVADDGNDDDDADAADGFFVVVARDDDDDDERRNHLFRLPWTDRDDDVQVRLDVRRVPASALSLDSARRVLFVGGAARVLREAARRKRDADDSKVEDEHEEEPDDEDVLERTWIDRRYEETSRRLYRLLMSDDPNNTLLFHLRNLCNSYLLGDGQLVADFLERCDAKGLWTAHATRGDDDDDDDDRYVGTDFHDDALRPALQDLCHHYEVEEEEVVQKHDDQVDDYRDGGHTPRGRLELLKRLSLVTRLPASSRFRIDRFDGTESARFSFVGRGVRHDHERDELVLSSAAGGRSGDGGGGLRTNAAHVLRAGSSAISLELSLGATEKEEDNDEGRVSLLIVPSDNDATSVVRARVEEGRRDHDHEDGVVVVRVRRRRDKDDDSDALRVDVNGAGAIEDVRIPRSKSVVASLTVKLEAENRIEAWLRVVSDEQERSRHFPPKLFLGTLAAKSSTWSPNNDDDAGDRRIARLGVAAVGTACRLSRWCLEDHYGGGDDSAPNEAVRYAKELDRLSAQDGASPAVKRITAKVHQEVTARLRWSDGGGENSPSLSLRYDLPWPHGVVVSASFLELHDRVFRRLLSVRRALWEIRRCWRVLVADPRRRRALGGGAERLWSAPLWAARARADHVLDGLSRHHRYDAVAAGWHRLARTARDAAAPTHETLRRAVAAYASDLRARSLSDHEEAGVRLSRICACATRLAALVRATPRSGDVPVAEVRRLSRRLDEETRALLATLRRSGTAPELCTRLDFNGYYGGDSEEERW